tara:strand:+ start:62 stop:292 length:231 start_codon:yes stop_codon:yes gene_type:complete
MAVAVAVAEHPQTLVVAELLLQIGQMFHQEQATLTHKQVVRVVQENNFHHIQESVQTTRTLLQAQVFLVAEQVVVA